MVLIAQGRKKRDQAALILRSAVHMPKEGFIGSYCLSDPSKCLRKCAKNLPKLFYFILCKSTAKVLASAANILKKRALLNKGN